MEDRKIVVENLESELRISVGVTLKINLGNYQSAEVSAHLTKSLPKDANVTEVQQQYQEIFETHVYPQIKMMAARIKKDFGKNKIPMTDNKQKKTKTDVWDNIEVGDTHADF